MNEFMQFLLMIIISAAVGGGAYYMAARIAAAKAQKQAADRTPNRAPPRSATQATSRMLSIPAQNGARYAIDERDFDESELDEEELEESEVKSLRQEVEFWMSQYNLTLLELAEGKQTAQTGNSALEALLASVPASVSISGTVAPAAVAMADPEAPVNIKLSILAIWPAQNDLNLQASRDALYNAGVNYIALTGTVTMADIVDEFSRNGFNALELGTHGKRLEMAGQGLEGGVWLSDGIASPGWWARLATFQKLKLAVVLACDSLQTGEAMLHAGVENVVAVQGLIEDAAAIKFSFLFYKYMAAGKTIAVAFDLAKLTLTRDQADTLRLLTRQYQS